MKLNDLSRLFSLAGRVTRDVNAVARGPEATARRVGRKAAWRGVAKGLRKVGI